MAATQQPQPQTTDGKLSRGCVKAASNYIDWHTLLARVYDIDSLKCPRCGGQLRMIAVITEPEPIRAILPSPWACRPHRRCRSAPGTHRCSTSPGSRVATWRRFSRRSQPRAPTRRHAAWTHPSAHRSPSGPIDHHPAPSVRCPRRRGGVASPCAIGDGSRNPFEMTSQGLDAERLYRWRRRLRSAATAAACDDLLGDKTSRGHGAREALELPMVRSWL